MSELINNSEKRKELLKHMILQLHQGEAPGEVRNRLHIGFDDPSEATGTLEFINSEFHRVRDEIKARFYDFYLNKLKPQLS